MKKMLNIFLTTLFVVNIFFVFNNVDATGSIENETKPILSIDKVIRDFDVDLGIKTMFRRTNRTYDNSNVYNLDNNGIIELNDTDFIHFKDGELFELQQPSQIQRVNNKNQKFVNNGKLDTDKIVDFLRKSGYVSDDYILNKLYNPIDSMWKISFVKKSRHNTINSFNSIKVSFDTVSGKIISFSRIDSYTKDPAPLISKLQALEIANNQFIKDGFPKRRKYRVNNC